MNTVSREEALQKYEAAQRQGRRFYSEKTGAGQNGYLPNFEDMDVAVVDSDINLGLLDIPIKKIRGTRSTGRSTAFAANFMPLLSPETEFAHKWQALYAAHLNEGIRDAIKVCEYMNYYYVEEGNKRVSVLKFSGAVSVTAEVRRIIPVRTNDDENKIFFELYDFDRRKIHDELWFSKPGRFPVLVRRAREFAAMAGLDAEKPSFLFDCFADFRREYKTLHPVPSELTTGDAFYYYTEIFGIPYNIGQKELEMNMKKLIPYLRAILPERTVNPETEGDIPHRNALGGMILSRRQHSVEAAFVISEPVGKSFWLNSHELARRRLESHYKGRLTTRAILREPDEVSVILPASPLFLLGPCTAREASKIGVINAETLVIACSPEFEGLPVTTYFPRLYETAFLAGALAGVLSRSSILGVLAPGASGMPAANLNAFACGALTVNPRSCVLFIEPDEDDCLSVRRQRLAGLGADIILQFSPDRSLTFKQTGGETLALLYSLAGNHPDQCLAALTADWTVFYRAIFDEMTDDSLGHYCLADGGRDIRHYRWGLSNGLINMLVSNAAVSDYPARLVRLFRRLLLDGTLTPFNGMSGFDADDLSHGKIFADALLMKPFGDYVIPID